MAPTLLKNLGIRTRLLLLCLAVAAPLLSMSGLVIWKEYQGLSQVARRASVYHDQVAVRTLEHWLSFRQEQLRSLAMLPPFRSFDLDAVRQVLITQEKLQSASNALALYNKNGELIAAGRQGLTTRLPLPADLVRQVLAGKAYVSNYTSCPITGLPAILLAQPVTRNEQVDGILIESIKPQEIASIFSDLGEPDGFVVIVVDATKRCIARSIDNVLWQGKDFSHAKTVTAAGAAKKGTIEVVGIIDPTHRTYAFDHIASTGWVVTVGIPTQSIYGTVNDGLVTLLCCMGVMVVLSLVLAYAFTRHFTGPIHELVKEAVSIGRGDLSKRVQTTQGGELGLLARAFNQMALNLELNREHKTMIERISESVRQSLDMHEILNTTVFELGRALSASRCCLAVVESESCQDISGKHLDFNYVWFNDKLGGTALKHRSVMITEGSILKIILEQGAILSLDVMDDSTFTPLFEQAEESPEDWKSIRSLIACPIVLNKQPIGMILVHQCDRRRVWFDLELELVEAVARHVALALDHGHLFARAREMAEQQSLINQIVRATRSSLEHDTILDTVTKELGTALDVDYCQIAQPRSEGPLVVTHEYNRAGMPSHKGLSLYGTSLDFHPESDDPQALRSVLGIDLSELRQSEGYGEPGFEMQEAPISVIQDVATDRRAIKFSEFLTAVGSKSLMAAPLLRDDRVLGILIMQQCRQARSWQPSEVRLMAAVADQLAVAVSHAQLFEHVQFQAITDGLTGLYNHIYFKNRLTEEINRAQRKTTPCSLLMLDLDKLKQINDTYGHPVGDAAIRQVALVLKSVLRSGDTAARYGGEEFAVILPETPLAEAAVIADRLRNNINRAPVSGLGHISTSIGVASFPTHSTCMAELIDKADRALYVAKRTGRNRVCVFDELAPPSPSAISTAASAETAGSSAAPVSEQKAASPAAKSTADEPLTSTQ